MQATNANRKSLILPLGISEAEAPLNDLLKLPEGLELIVPDSYEELVLSTELSGEVFAIQRLLTIAKLGIPITIVWTLPIRFVANEAFRC